MHYRPVVFYKLKERKTYFCGQVKKLEACSKETYCKPISKAKIRDLIVPSGLFVWSPLDYRWWYDTNIGTIYADIACKLKWFHDYMLLIYTGSISFFNIFAENVRWYRRDLKSQGTDSSQHPHLSQPQVGDSFRLAVARHKREKMGVEFKIGMTWRDCSDPP